MSNTTEAKNKETFEYKAEMKQLLKLIAHSLYAHPEVFIRELVSNASDALNKVRFKKLTDKNIIDSEKELRIDIEIDEEKQYFKIRDTGTGMNKDDLINQIGTVAKSGTLDFIESMKKSKGQIDGDLIGQFGVGFYSVYMVSDKVNIKTLHMNNDSESLKWTSKGEDNFEIKPIKKKDRGTEIYFKLRDEFKEFSNPEKVKSILKKYSNFIEYPIYVNGEKINTVKAIWQKPKEDLNDEDVNEFYKFLTNDFQDPLGYLHLNIEGVVNFKSIIFFPKNAPMNLFSEDYKTTLNLYTNKVFIQNNADWMLPDYLKFLKGVIDTADLPLNVSREVTQHSPQMTKIKDIITGKVISELEKWAKNDKEKYISFYKEFGPLFKTGISSDFKNKDRIINLLRFNTNLDESEYLSLSEYVEKIDKDSNEIVYVSGDNMETAKRNPNLEYFNENNIPVLYFTDPVDTFILPHIGEFEGKSLVSVDKAKIDDKKSNECDSDNNQQDIVIEKIKEYLGERVEDVIPSKRLVNSPCSLSTGKSGMDSQMEKMMQMMDKNFEGSKKVLEINLSHPILKNLKAILESESESEKAKIIINQLYSSAMLLDGRLKDAEDYVNNVYKMMNEFSKN